MAERVTLPPAFDADQEAHPFLVRVKKKAAKDFRWSKAGCLENALRLAWWLFIFGKEEEALEVCRFLGQSEFKGNFNLWTWVELGLALQARLTRQRGLADEAERCRERIAAAGFAKGRLEGNLLDGAGGRRDCVRQAAASGDETRERDWSAMALMELCFVIEMVGSNACPVAHLEQEFEQICARLRTLLDVPAPGT
jgi:hypothetical protein